MAGQPLGFALVLGGGVLLDMGISGHSIREVLAGRGGTIKPLVPSTSTSSSSGSSEETSIKGASPAAQKLVSFAESQKGVKQGSAKELAYARLAGISGGEAWCAAYVTWVLAKVGIAPPSGPASVADWENWSGGKNIGTDLANARPGDLLRFGGEHLAIYIGGGKMISGNWNNEVAIANVSEEISSVPLSEIIRVKGLYTKAATATLGEVGGFLGQVPRAVGL